MERFTYDAVNAILSHRCFWNNHQVGVYASLPQVVTAVTAIPRLHIKLTMKTLHGALWDVHTAVHTYKVVQITRAIVLPTVLPH